MATPCLFVSDLHGSNRRYEALWRRVADERPAAVFLGGDLLPGSAGLADSTAFIERWLEIPAAVCGAGSAIFLVPGNDDPARDFLELCRGADRGLWTLLNGAERPVGRWRAFGYGYVPPTPFLLKDWERYDVSRFVDPGSVSPEEGQRTLAVDADDIRYGTIQKDLAELAGDTPQDDAVWLFHSPPYDTDLDRADLDGRMVDHVPLDVHVGSIAIRRFIEQRKPLVTLHGHVHESARMTGAWRQQLGRTWMLSAAHDGPELALVRFDLEDLENATRELV